MLFELIKDHLFLSIYILINLIVFFLYGIDKWKAIHHKWRIPEAHLILAGVFGIFGADIKSGSPNSTLDFLQSSFLNLCA